MRRSPARPARGVDRGKGRGLGTVVGGSSPPGAPSGYNMDSGGQARDVGGTIKRRDEEAGTPGVGRDATVKLAAKLDSAQEDGLRVAPP